MSEPWQDTCSTITSALYYMMKKEIIVDVVFKRHNVPCLYAHKFVLSLWSPYFEDIMKQSDKGSTLKINFNEDIDAMETVLEYVYSSSKADTCFTKMPIQKLIQVIEITERFDIQQIHQRCLSSLQRRKIDPMNVIDFFDFGLRKNLETVVQKCVKVLSQHGIGSKNLREDISVSTLLALLSTRRVAVESESILLNIAISWLSHPLNKCFKYEVLSFVDLAAIEWTEYQITWKKFPNFFSEEEMSSILFGITQKDITRIPSWYKREMSSVVEKNCDTCIFLNKRLSKSKFYHQKREYKKDLKEITQAFRFKNSDKARLRHIELNFGPNDIPISEFQMKFSRSGIGNWNEGYLDTVKQSKKYVMFLEEPLMLKASDGITLKFYFRKGLVANKILVANPNAIESQKLNETLKKDGIEIEKKSSKLAFYCASDGIPKYLVSCFYFNLCSNHAPYLSRKRIISKKPKETVIKMDTGYNTNDPKIKIFDRKIIKKEEMWIK